MRAGRLASARQRVHHFLHPRPRAPMAPPAPPNAASAADQARPLAPLAEALIDVPSAHADQMVAALRASGWTADDTGLTVTTDDGEDHLTQLRVRPASALAAGGPTVRGAIFAAGDLVIGEGLQVEGAVFAEGAVTIGRDATVLGTVAAGGDLVMLDGAVAGDAFAGGWLRKAASARASSVVARKGTIDLDAPR